MASFDINAHQYDLPFPSYSEPKEMGNFSLDGTRSYCDDKRQMKYLWLPQEKLDGGVRFDLNMGYELATKKPFHVKEKLDNLLKWMMSKKNELEELKKRKNCIADFVCYRGLLTTVLCTPYENREGWIICATKFNNIIYLCQFDTPDKQMREANMSEQERLMSSWGYKFEQFLSTDDPHVKPNPHVPVNEMEEFCSVVRTQLSNFSLLFGAEMDCVDSQRASSTSMSRYYELKTSRHITSSRQDRNFKRFKLLKWWAQSFLIGIQQIICGFRDDEGIVHNLQTYSLDDIPKMVQGLWKPAVCMNFCLKVLQFIKATVEIDNPELVYKFSWSPGNKVTCEVLKNSEEYGFLPPWFVNEFGKV